LASSTETAFPVHGFAPRWAPNSASIAYLAISQGGGGPIDIIQSDGTGNRVVKANTYDFGLDWSPDGQWLISQNDSTTALDIINVNTGMTLPLPFTNSNTWSPSWGPASAYPISHADPMATRARPRGAPHRR
jgi:Tol biopolymer transport system component